MDLQQIWDITAEQMNKFGNSHDMTHIKRVFRWCKVIAEKEANVDLEILLTAAILHDIARGLEDHDTTGEIDHALLGAEMAGDILQKIDFPSKKIAAVQACIRCHRFRGANRPETIEAKILSDADKIDIFDAIGIARCFMIAGEFNEPIYSNADPKQYKKENIDTLGRVIDDSKHTANLEFEIKLKHAMDRLYTDTAKEISKEKLAFMQLFFDRLRADCDFEIDFTV